MSALRCCGGLLFRSQCSRRTYESCDSLQRRHQARSKDGLPALISDLPGLWGMLGLEFEKK